MRLTARRALCALTRPAARTGCPAPAPVVERAAGSFLASPTPIPARRPLDGFLSADQCQAAELSRLVEQPTRLADYPLASDVEQGVLVYHRSRLNLTGQELLAEWARALLDGPGVLVVRGAFDHSTVDRASAALDAVIAREAAGERVAGDHFAAPGTNQRVWNALEKHAVEDPASWVEYYSNPVLAAAARGWLGPNYQVTAQLNAVLPGGQAQAVHRDYHLGFCTDALAEQFPAHVHALSPLLTLQGAVAHTDMPIESGPTCLLPRSQKYLPGYLAWRRPEFQQLFADRMVQLPLEKGDGLFFNPALLHAAGANTSRNIRRVANLLQVSSAFGRAMETVDRSRVCRVVYPALRAVQAREGWTAQMTSNVIAAAAEGYSFPTNLDTDPPVDGLAPESQADTLRAALAEEWTLEKLDGAQQRHKERAASH